MCSDICLEEEIDLCGDGINSNFYNQTIIIEACDDGNRVSGDGCSADCLFVEPGYECLEWGKPCTLLCGNGFVEDFYLSKLTEDGEKIYSAEECDLGALNTDEGSDRENACSKDCKVRNSTIWNCKV